MPLTLRGLLTLPGLDLKVQAGAANLDREVRCAHATELDDPTPWLTGGELILTTGWQKVADDPSWASYIERLDAAGAAALGFGLGVAHASIPLGLLRGAEQSGFPLLSVPLALPFIAIVRAVAERLAEDRMAEVRKTLDNQTWMIRTAAERGVAGVIADFAQLVCGAVVVTDPNLKVRIAEPPDNVPLLESVSTLLGQSKWWRGRGGASVSDAAGQLTVQTVESASETRGYVAVATATPLTPMQRILLNQVTALVALEWRQPPQLRERDNGLRAVLLELALDGALTGRQVRRHACHFGFAKADDVVAVSVTTSLPVDAAARLTYEALTRLDCPFLACTGPDEVLVVTTAQWWRQAIDELLARLKAAPDPGVSVGIGTPKGWGGLARTVQQARQASDAGHARHLERVEFQNMGVFGILLGTRPSATLTELADGMLESLDDYDRGGGELVTSLNAFLQHNGHWEAAAAALGIHRHSLRYRIHKIEKLTGRSLDSSTNRTEFHIAIIAREFVHNMAHVEPPPP